MKVERIIIFIVTLQVTGIFCATLNNGDHEQPIINLPSKTSSKLNVNIGGIGVESDIGTTTMIPCITIDLHYIQCETLCGSTDTRCFGLCKQSTLRTFDSCLMKDVCKYLL